MLCFKCSKHFTHRNGFLLVKIDYFNDSMYNPVVHKCIVCNLTCSMIGFHNTQNVMVEFKQVKHVIIMLWKKFFYFSSTY